MAKTLDNLSDHARTLLDEASTSDWTDAEVTREVNASYMELYANVVEVYEDYYTKKSQTSTVADQQEYTLPSDFLKIRRVEINYDTSVSDSNPLRAHNIMLDEVMRNIGNEALGTTVSSIAAYYIRGNIIGFIPIPTRAGTNAITIWYIAIPSELSASSDAIDVPFPDRYGQLIALKAAAMLLRKGQQEEAVARQYILEYNAGIEKMKQELEDRIAEGGRAVIDTQGQDIDFSYWY